MQNWLLILGVLLFMAVFCRKLLPVVRHAQAAALLRQVNVFENSLRNRHVAMQKISFEDYLAKRKEVTMSDPQNRDPAPRTLEARRDLVGYVMFSIYRGRRHYVDDCPPWFGVSIARTVRSFVRGRVMRNFLRLAPPKPTVLPRRPCLLRQRPLTASGRGMDNRQSGIG